MAQEGCKVLLNVYDLSQGLARQLSTTFLGKAIEGIWHTGIVVFGNEYYFGGGIQSCPEGQTPYGRPVKVVELGYTEVPKEVFEDYLQDVSPRYTAQTYSLLQHNCNNFSEEVSQFLCGVGIPDFILKVPEEVMNSPMGALIMPMIQQFETILKYGGVPQVPHAIPHVGPTQLPSLSEMPAFPGPLSIPGNGNGSASQRLPSTGAVSASALVVAPMHSALRPTGSEKTAEKSVTDPKMSTTHDELAVPHAGPTQLPSLSEMPALPALLSIPGNGNGSASQRLPSTGAGSASALVGAPTHSHLRQTGSAEKCVTDPKMSTTRDELARARVQEEITREFTALMAEGRLRASEAAAIATQRVIERHGRGVGLSSQS